MWTCLAKASLSLGLQRGSYCLQVYLTEPETLNPKLLDSYGEVESLDLCRTAMTQFA